MPVTPGAGHRAGNEGGRARRIGENRGHCRARSGVSAATKAGNVSSVPPPATELTAPATNAVRHSHNRLRSGIVYGLTIA